MSDGTIELAADIVTAYVSNNSVPVTELAALITDVHRSLGKLNAEPTKNEILTPAVNPKRSVRDDYIICLEDGKKFKSLKRHLAAHYDMTPEEYRARWGLPANYPMVAPGYSATRSALAKEAGLGRKLIAKSTIRSRRKAKA